MKKAFLIIIVLCISLTGTLVAQTCGTQIPKDFFKTAAKMATVQDTGYQVSYTEMPDVNLSISLYSGDDSLMAIVFQSAVDSLNDAFASTGISFSICKSTTIKETRFSTISSEINEEELRTLYRTKNTINVYLVGNLMSGQEYVCGYAYLPSGNQMDYIFIDLDCNLANTLIHEMGHFFGLLHTHERQGGAELVDGSNCEFAGDLICDTEASPNLQNRVEDDCTLKLQHTDANGDYYSPSVSNFMSYSRPECRCAFTPGQVERMIQFYWSHRTHLH